MLTAFTHIFTQVLLPVLLLTGAGFILQRQVGCDVRSLARVNLYLLVPALTFVRLNRSQLTIRQALQVAVYVLALVLLLWLWSHGVARLRRYSPQRRSAFSVSQMFYNSGNFGIPVNQLAFGGDPLAASVQVIVLATQNLLNFTLGLIVLSHGRRPWGQSLKALLRYPFVYALVLALSLRSAGWTVWPPVMTALEYLADGLIPLALITLGAQLALVRLHGIPLDGLLACAGRLVLAPVIGFGLLALVDGSSLFRQALVLSCGSPTAVNAAMLAIEFDADPEFASQVTFLSTLLSGLTVTVLLMVLGAGS